MMDIKSELGLCFMMTHYNKIYNNIRAMHKKCVAFCIYLLV